MYQIISDENEITCFIIIQQIMLILIAAFISLRSDKSWKLIENCECKQEERSEELVSPLFSITALLKKKSCLNLFNYLLFANSQQARDFPVVKGN